jgi:hypothetical protein
MPNLTDNGALLRKDSWQSGKDKRLKEQTDIGSVLLVPLFKWLCDLCVIKLTSLNQKKHNGIVLAPAAQKKHIADDKQ